MKKIIFIAAVLFSISFFVSESKAQSKDKKILVTYFTLPETDGVDASSGASRVVVNDKLYGATEYVANEISELTGGDLFQIKTENTYPGTHKALIDYAKKEAESKTYPVITSKIKNFQDYDVVFVGYPNWWYDMPMVIYSLFKDYDFSGKTIIPFCTHGGSGFSQSVETIAGLEKNAKVISIPAISRSRVTSSRSALEKWLKEQGLAK